MAFLSKVNPLLESASANSLIALIGQKSYPSLVSFIRGFRSINQQFSFQHVLFFLNTQEHSTALANVESYVCHVVAQLCFGGMVKCKRIHKMYAMFKIDSSVFQNVLLERAVSCATLCSEFNLPMDKSFQVFAVILLCKCQIFRWQESPMPINILNSI